VTEQESSADIVLITCVKTKRQYPCAAKDLYSSSLFSKQRSYAEKSGLPWFILSAEYGLVAPDEWLSPYERYLPDTPADYRLAWGAWVAARLELLVGPLMGLDIEIHAGSKYLAALRSQLEGRGATVSNPLLGFPLGERLAWYGKDQTPSADGVVSDSEVIARLLDHGAGVTPGEFLARGKASAGHPGLYSWWVDEAGAATLARGLGFPIQPGLIYAGLAGATRWPSGQRSRNTLWLRIATMHLAGNHEFSTFRRTIGAILATASGSNHIDEQALSCWIAKHLRVVTVRFDDRDELGRLEQRVLAALDPPVNLRGMSSTELRLKLAELRSRVTKGS
jgi:ribosomal protein L29